MQRVSVLNDTGDVASIQTDTQLYSTKQQAPGFISRFRTRRIVSRAPFSFPLQWLRIVGHTRPINIVMPPPHTAEALSDDARLTSVCRVHLA